MRTLGPFQPGDHYLMSIDYHHPWVTKVLKVIVPGQPSQLVYEEIVALADNSLETRVRLDQIGNPQDLVIGAYALEYIESIGQIWADSFPSYIIIKLR